LKFFSDPQNLALIGLAVAAGGMLFVTTLKGRGGAASLTSLQATQMMNHKNAVVIDVRTPEEFAGGSLVGARNIPVEALATRLAELSRFKGRPVIVVCQSGARSGRAIGQFTKEGFTEVYNLAGGIGSWQSGGLPLAKSAK
jgi:rhodanese-related sulfurtransferase